MTRKQVRWYFLVYGVMGPWICVGLFFFVLLLGASYMVDAAYEPILWKVGLASLISSCVIGFAFAVVFVVRTRNVDKAD